MESSPDYTIACRPVKQERGEGRDRNTEDQTAVNETEVYTNKYVQYTCLGMDDPDVMESVPGLITGWASE